MSLLVSCMRKSNQCKGGNNTNVDKLSLHEKCPLKDLEYGEKTENHGK